MDRYLIDNYIHLLEEIEQFDELVNLRELERKIIAEIVILIQDGSRQALDLLHQLEDAISDKLSCKEKNKLLTIALRKSITGAFATAKNLN